MSMFKVGAEAKLALLALSDLEKRVGDLEKRIEELAAELVNVRIAVEGSQ
jgi:uncharacterized small protein (DUF1192 family)